MSAALHAATYERLRREAAWKLLSADLAPDVLALLQHLLYDTQRALPASVLHERLTTELAELRAQGRDLQGSAAQYVGQWLREGWLERRFPEGALEEEFELSAAAQQALRVVAGLQTSRAVATESRLSLVMDELAKLSRDTDTDPTVPGQLIRAISAGKTRQRRQNGRANKHGRQMRRSTKNMTPWKAGQQRQSRQICYRGESSPFPAEFQGS